MNADAVISRVSLYRLSIADRHVVDPKGDRFDATGYSRFKYGDAEVADLYATKLVERLHDADEAIELSGLPLVITTAPFKFVPTASFQLAKEMQRHLRAVSYAGCESSVSIVPLYMRNMDPGNYSARDQLERNKILDQAGLHVDPREIRGRNVLLVDDAIVTGTAERAAIGILTDAGAMSVTGAYVIEMEQDCGRMHPEAEDALNHAFVRNLDALLELFQTAPIRLNIRTIKFVLGWPALGEVHRFFSGIAATQLAEFSEAVMKDKDSFLTAYPEALELLLQMAIPPGP